ncbi:putative divalent heavy-metal cations transporter [Nosema bombycis CQ1]|uniref:Putative divalent heavy-metal cations transporter n=1 Tax=Nosema bombycis (strain CQ1 / CVCC 102059) TaxID=578461 RepID=R0KML6_NOSB1|nr:putative divalent heavy-metal cations transporter [Nosema bombycis CQ1]|eukprot:EOB11876.1 putative divalent heavy-metal cations transporter [Nosema bombycis CQ1]
MNINTNATNNIIMKTCSYTDFQEMFIFRTGFTNIFFLSCSICFNSVFVVLIRYKKINSTFSTVMDIMKSILSGLIISLFFNSQHTKNVRIDSLPSFLELLLNNLPLILMGTAYFLVGSCVRIHRAKNRNNNLSNDTEIFVTDMKDTNKEESKSTYIFNAVKKFYISITEEYNTYFYHTIYLFLIFFHSFFSGLGFSGNQYIGLYGIIILVRKLYESFRIQQAFKKLGFNKSKAVHMMLFFSFITPIGLLIRVLLSLNGVSADKSQAIKLCQKMFFQSCIMMTCFDFFIPIPRSWLEVALNIPLTLISYSYFNLYFTNNDPVL